MAYSIEYYRQGQLLGSQPWPASLQEAIAQAQDQMTRRRADSARIIENDGTGAEVWSGSNDAPGS